VPVGIQRYERASKLNASAVICDTARDGIAGDKGAMRRAAVQATQTRARGLPHRRAARRSGRRVRHPCQPLQQRLEKLTDEEGSRVL